MVYVMMLSCGKEARASFTKECMMTARRPSPSDGVASGPTAKPAQVALSAAHSRGAVRAKHDATQAPSAVTAYADCCSLSPARPPETRGVPRLEIAQVKVPPRIAKSGSAYAPVLRYRSLR